MRHFVEGQGKQQDRECDENLREVDVYESLDNGSGLRTLGLLA
jgi:hypothetical protein